MSANDAKSKSQRGAMTQMATSPNFMGSSNDMLHASIRDGQRDKQHQLSTATTLDGAFQHCMHHTAAPPGHHPGESAKAHCFRSLATPDSSGDSS